MGAYVVEVFVVLSITVLFPRVVRVPPLFEEPRRVGRHRRVANVPEDSTSTPSPVFFSMVVDRLRHLGKHHALGATAVVVVADLSYGVIRMLEALLEDICDVRPFRNLGKA